jgi:hypothetical protein
MERYTIDEVQGIIVDGLLATVRIAQLVSGEAIAVGKKGELQEMSLLLGVDYGVVSDTIVLFPRSTTRNPLATLCSTVAILMTELLAAGLVLRGAIDVDTFRAIEGHNIYIGKAVIGAHKLEVSQEWAGCALSRRVGKKFPREFSSLRRSGLVMSYPIPFKKRLSRPTEHWVVNWFYYRLGDQVEKVNKLLVDRSQVGGPYKFAPRYPTTKW